jgi:hypothetical protein
MEMNTYTPAELSAILEKHRLWLSGDPEGVRANLVRANLDGANLVRARLVGASLVRANLVGANLDGASLLRDKLVGANLDGAHLAWNDHTLRAAILFRAAGEDVNRRKIAGLVLVSRDWCWEQFGELMDADPIAAEWVRSVLIPLDTQKSPAPAVVMAKVEVKS